MIPIPDCRQILGQHAAPFAFALVGAFSLFRAASAAPFQVQGPGVNPQDFRITTFASGLDYPLGMAKLSDGSLLVAVSRLGGFFGNSNGQLIRLADTNQDGIADGAGQVLYTGLPGGQTSLRMWRNLIFVTGQGQGKPISILRAGATPDAPLTLVGRISINYPSGAWEHPHSALGIRPTPGQTESCDLLFQLGSDQNFAKTTRTAALSSTEVAGASGILEGDSIYMLTLTDNLTNIVASNLRHIARGLRNPAGFGFHPVTGDLYFGDNGIDGLVDPNEPLSADELNLIPAVQIGNGIVPDFGFPSNYTAYRTGTLVGGQGVQPLVAFQPLPDPLTGSESEGPNDIAFAPPGFPPGLNNGIFIGFHGKFSECCLANEENPLVYVDLTTTNYFHFIGNDEPEIGHLDGLLPTEDSLFVADLTANGSLSSGSTFGVIYQIKSLVNRVLSLSKSNNTPVLTWTHGVLQKADSLAGTWNDIPGAASPYPIPIEPDRTAAFYRTRW